VEREGYDAFSTFQSEIKLEIGYVPRIIASDLDQRGLGVYSPCQLMGKIFTELSSVNYVTDPPLMMDSVLRSRRWIVRRRLEGWKIKDVAEALRVTRGRIK